MTRGLRSAGQEVPRRGRRELETSPEAGRAGGPSYRSGVRAGVVGGRGRRRATAGAVSRRLGERVAGCASPVPPCSRATSSLWLPPPCLLLPFVLVARERCDVMRCWWVDGPRDEPRGALRGRWRWRRWRWRGAASRPVCRWACDGSLPFPVSPLLGSHSSHISLRRHLRHRARHPSWRCEGFVIVVVVEQQQQPPRRPVAILVSITHISNDLTSSIVSLDKRAALDVVLDPALPRAIS